LALGCASRFGQTDPSARADSFRHSSIRTIHAERELLPTTRPWPSRVDVVLLTPTTPIEPVHRIALQHGIRL
jgi:hypothetical protein